MGNRYILAGVGPVAFTGEDKIKIRKFDDVGHIIKEYKLGNKIYPFFIDCDINGNVYVAAYYDPSYDFPPIPYTNPFIILNHDGYQVQSGINHNGARIGKFLFDSAGNIIVTGEAVNDSGHVYYPNYDYVEGQVRSGYYTTRKFSPSGTELWKIDNHHAADSYTYGTAYTGNSNGGGALGADFVIDSNNDIIMALYNSEFGIKTLRKFSGSDGSVIWEQYIGTPYLGFYDGYFKVLVDNSNNIYAFGRPPAGSPSDWAYVVYKYNSSGVFQGNSGNIYLPYRGKNSTIFNGSNWQFVNGIYVITLGTDLSVTLTEKFGSFLYGSPWTSLATYAFDSSGYLYAGFYKPRDVPSTFNSLAKADLSARSILWQFEDWSPLPKFVDGGYNSCTCLSVIENPVLPAIPLELGIGKLTVIGDLYTNIPAIPLETNIGAITQLLDFAGKIEPKLIFRCYLTGGTGTIQLIQSSFTCRKSDSGITLDVVIASPSLQQIIDVTNRTAGQLIVKAGYLLSDNTEQLSDIIITNYNSMRTDKGSQNSSMTITGKTSNIVLNQKTRKIKGINYRNTINGRRLIRCSIDFYINEGDIADLGGGETFVVSSIYLNVNTNNSYMEIQE